jgi:hypothetical protein
MCTSDQLPQAGTDSDAAGGRPSIEEILAAVDHDLIEAGAQSRRWQAIHRELSNARDALAYYAAHPELDPQADLDARLDQVTSDLEEAEADLLRAQERVRDLRGVVTYLGEQR